MQDRYVGDAGDYAKYALLKALAGPTTDAIRLGVLWYLFPDEGHNGDGRHIAYLQQPLMAARDPETHAALKELVRTGQRSVEAVQRSSLLPADTLYYASQVAARGTPAVRVAHRTNWFQEGIKSLAAADLIFFDPDNGVETPALKQSDFKAGKYAFWEEIEAAWLAGKSLVIYNHLNRSAPAAVQTSRLQDIFQRRLVGSSITPLLFRRGSCRHLWVISQSYHANKLVDRTKTFLEEGWHADTDAPLDL